MPIIYITQEKGSCCNNESIEDLVFTVSVYTFLLRCYPVAKHLINGHIRLIYCVSFFLARTWKAAFSATITTHLAPEEYSSKVNAKRIVKRAKFYRSQLGFPEVCPPEHPGNVLNKFYVTNDMDANLWLKQFDKEDDYHEDETTFLSLIIAIKKPYKFVQRSLHFLLDEMQEIALRFFVAEEEGEEAIIAGLEDVNLTPRV